MEELATRRNALDTERRALEDEEERLRAAVVAAGTGRDEAEARRKQAEAELARARSEVESAREKDSLVLPHTHQLPKLSYIIAIWYVSAPQQTIPLGCVPTQYGRRTWPAFCLTFS